MNRPRDRRHAPNGFTLIELLVVVAILAILAAVAVPSLTRASAAGAVQDATTMLSNMAFHAKMEAIGKRTDRILVLRRHTFELTDNASTPALFYRADLPAAAWVFNVANVAAEPGSAPPSPSTVTDDSSPLGAICFRPTGSVAWATSSGTNWSCAAGPATIYITSGGDIVNGVPGEWKSRIVIHQATGFVKTYDSW